MLIKADCLRTAGIINEAEKQYVHSRAHTFLYDATLKDAAFLKSHMAYNERPRQAYLGASRTRAPGREISPALVDGVAARSCMSVVKPRATPIGSAARTAI